ncbi:dihydrolipoamide succinyltransferase [Cephaloticoccus capnophilus]|uniref:Dihydrolipoyllysine-residue succinyltransferase component of 2-oxoglutarate dehydrogenase complex n=1 Tax=Cephaloticoccus capnophilus TaxID=1548208 RepID=A0A139STC6_9BACT|nr:2-oxoglutarate dehydrogenase complex dihydrolipoyllysine-residue succinyltransferase [Cephaloticoccus capnophilus]KXU37826.1 dihydrolipoamide succinyltransferase [Cephaloticoccus capnophilus]
MSLAVKIPNLGESITTGLLVKWHVADGDIVQKDQPLYELETDKITAEGTAEVSGKIALKVTEGTEVKIGETVAEIDEKAASASSPATSTGAPAAAPTSASPNKKDESPAVRRLAAESGIDPASVTGTGKAGRVTKADMLAAASAPKAVAPQPSKSAAPAPAARPVEKAKTSRKKLSSLRARIAERLVQAQHEAAMLTTFNEVDMSAVMALRQKYQDSFVKKHGIKLGFMSFFAKAVVHALQEVPAINARIEGDTLVENHYYDLGVAVSTPKGLMVPVIRDCDSLGMADIEQQIAAAATKARDGKITLADLEGGVFTITNGGIFGSMLSTPILNAPQSAILGLHAINERPVAIDGQVVIRPMMYLALSYDHRVVDGREAVTFLVKVKQAIEDPARLLIGA